MVLIAARLNAGVILVVTMYKNSPSSVGEEGEAGAIPH